jgi:hypothetical protein
MRHVGLCCGNTIEVTPVRVMGLRMATDHHAVSQGGACSKHTCFLEQLYRRAAILAQGLVKFQEILAGMERHGDARSRECQRANAS